VREGHFWGGHSGECSYAARGRECRTDLGGVRGFPLHAAEGVVVDEVGAKAGEAFGVVELDADVVVDGEDDGVGGDEEVFGLGEGGVAPGGICEGGGVGEEAVVVGVLPAGAVVAAGCGEHFEEGVGVVVVADPA